jgi:hypothetical protein
MSSDVWVGFFFTGLGLPFTVYVVLQFVAPFFVRGWRRLAILLPLPIMAWVLLTAIQSFHQESNMWPILIIFFSPFAIVFVGLILVLDYYQGTVKATSNSPESPRTVNQDQLDR